MGCCERGGGGLQKRDLLWFIESNDQVYLTVFYKIQAPYTPSKFTLPHIAMNKDNNKANNTNHGSDNAVEYITE